MIGIDIRPVWRFHGRTEREFDFQLIALLGEVDASGKLTSAAEKAGMSYRHAWNLIGEWEAFFGAPLVAKEQGRGSTLTALGERLLWAGRRAQARLAPELANLAAEFARSINEPLIDGSSTLTAQASHDFAIGELRTLAAEEGVDLDLHFKGSFDALGAMRRGECELAGFHVPDGMLGALLARRYAEGLPSADYRLVTLATRAQGLIVRPGNPKAIRTIADLARGDVRVVNRQRGSGTRALLEFFIASQGLDRSRIAGYDTEESTHGAVAALIAGRQADVGLGVRAAAAEYRLDFVPICTERYYLACHERTLQAPAMQRLLQVLASDAFRARVEALPGYFAHDAGRVVASLHEPALARE